MAKVIDEKVVSLEFDNRRFEKNVSATLNTLDKLKSGLQFKDAGKGFEEVSQAASKVDMNKLEQGIETVKVKFSALQVAAVTALTNITNSAVNAGKRLVASLSTDQIVAGWNKYEQKTSSVQTIMNSTGKTIDQVNGYLDKLMWYSDQTSYGFTDMTQSLAQLTSAGGDIEKLIPMIQGIANATAFAGKGAAEFSRVIYNLNQSYSAGYLQYMDWKSLDLAGVSSKQLKQMLIDTGVALGTIQEGQVTIENFAQTLKDKWATTEVMEQAFGKFSEFGEAVYDLVEANPDMKISDAIDSLADSYDEVVVKAFKAAQEAKTFREAIDATKDAVSSGWMRTSEIIFGDYEESKKIWSRLCDTMWDIFASGGETRNEILQKALGSGWKSMMSDAVLFEDGFEAILEKTIKDKGIDLDKLIQNEGSLEKAVQNLLQDGTVTADDLSVALHKSADELKNCTDEQLKELGLTREMVDGWNLSADAVEGYAEAIGKLSGREMLIEGIANIGKSILTIFEKIKEAWNSVFPSSVESKANSLYKGLSGFYNITEKIFNVIDQNGDKIKDAFVAIFTPIKLLTTAVKTLFGFIWPAFKWLSSMLYEIAKIPMGWISKLGSFFGKLNKTSKTTEKVSNSMERFKKALSSVGKGFKTYIVNLKEAFEQSKFLNNVFNAMKKIFNGLKKIVSSVGNIIVSFFENLGKALENADVTTFVALLNTALSSGVLVAIFKGLKEFKGIKKGFESITGVFDKIRDTLKSYQNQLNAEVIKDIAIAIGILAASLVAMSLVDSNKLWTAVGAMSVLVAVIAGALVAIGKLTSVFDSGGGDKEATGFAGTFKNILTNIGESIGAGLKNFLNKIGTASMIAAFGTTLLMIAGAIKIMSTMGWKEMGVGLITMTVCMGLLMGAMYALSQMDEKDAEQAKKNVKQLKSIAVSVAVLAGSLKLVSGMSWEEMGIGLISLGSLIVLLTGATVLIGRFAKIGNKTTNKGLRLMMLIATSVLLITIPLLALSLMPWQKILTGLGEIFLVFAMLTTATILLGRIAKIGMKATTKGIATLLFMATSLLIVSAPLIVLSVMPWKRILIGIGEIFLLLAALTGAAILIGRFADVSGMGLTKGMTAMLLLATTLILLTAPLVILSLMPWDKMLIGLGAVVGIMLILTGIVALLSLITGGGTSLLALAGSLAVLAIALNLLVIPLLAFSQLDWPSLGKAGAALGVLLVALLALVGIGYLATGASVGLLALGGAVALMGLGLILGSVGIGLLAGSLATLLVILSENKDNLPLLMSLGESLIVLGAAAIVAGAGFVVLAAGLALLQLAIAFLPLSVQALSLFVDEFAVVTEKLKNSIDGEVLAKAGLIVGLFGILAAASIVSSVLLPGALMMTLAALELQLFANTIKPFFDLLRKDVTSDLAAKAGILTGVLGIMVGASLVGLLASVTSIGLPLVAAELSAFMREMKTFLDGLKTVDNSTLTKAKSVKQIIELFTGGGLFDGIKISTVKKSLTGIGDAITDLSESLNKPSGLTDAANGVTKLANSLKDFANNSIKKFVDGVDSLRSEVTDSFTEIASAAADCLKSVAIYNEFYSAGRYLAEGFSSGIESKNSSIMATVRTMANNAVAAVKKALGIQSPSKVFYELGGFGGEGFTNAFNDYNTVTYKSGYDMGTSASKGLSEAMSRVSRVIEGDVNTQPTIRPVLDLSDVASGAGTIDSLFGSNRSVGVLAELGPINSAVNRIQNRRSDDSLFAAISDLKNTMQNTSGNTYNINGITYDNGSELQAAIETIIRAAKVERRR